MRTNTLHQMLFVCLLLVACGACKGLAPSLDPSANTQRIAFVETVNAVVPLRAGQPGQLELHVSAQANPGMLAASREFRVDRSCADYIRGLGDGRFAAASQFIGLYVPAGNWDADEVVGDAGAVALVPVNFAAAGTYIVYIGSTRLQNHGGKSYSVGANPENVDYPVEDGDIEYRAFTIEVLP